MSFLLTPRALVTLSLLALVAGCATSHLDDDEPPTGSGGAGGGAASSGDGGSSASGQSSTGAAGATSSNATSGGGEACSDGKKSGDETAVDCGGSCAPCPNDKSCAVGGDCLSGFCDAASQLCKAPPTCNRPVVISQVYGGGGTDSSSPYRADFIELHNRSAQAIDVSGWSVQYASDTGNFGGSVLGVTVLPSGASIAPGGYFLIKEADGAAYGASLPAYDAVGSGDGISMGTKGGKVALVSSGTMLGKTACPSGADVVDLVGWGSVTTACAGTTPDLNSKLSAMRDDEGCGTGFAGVAVAPRNSSSTARICATCD